MLSRYVFVGRRRGGRRAGEVYDIHVDRCTQGEALSVGTLLLLAVVDWWWTLAHLARGVEEANPLLRGALAAGGAPAFTAAKIGITLVVGAFLFRHVRFRLTRVLLPAAIAVYAAVLVVHGLTEAALDG